jgi:hypothetical protein
MATEVAEDFDIKKFVYSLCKLEVTTSSKEIAEFLTKKGHPCSWQVIAGLKGKFNKQH